MGDGTQIGARLESSQRVVEELRLELDRHLGALGAREFTAESADGRVRVTVDGSGTVRAVRVDPQRLGSLSGAELGHRVVDAVGAARQAGTVELRQVLARVPGGDALARLADTPEAWGTIPHDRSGEGGEPEVAGGESDDVDDVIREVRRFRDQLPQWVDELKRLSAAGEGARGSVWASCEASGVITRVDIDTRLLRGHRLGEVDAAILQALQAAQASAARLMRTHQERVELLGLPIGEVLSGRRRLSDFFPPLSTSPTEPR